MALHYLIPVVVFVLATHRPVAGSAEACLYPSPDGVRRRMMLTGIVTKAGSGLLNWQLSFLIEQNRRLGSVTLTILRLKDRQRRPEDVM
jgi:hypothetical protein